MSKNVRAYSLLTERSVNDGKRQITGIATTPTPDRMGDVVEPLGIKFNNPMPLLWQHQSDKPVGTVTFGKPTSKGIPFTAEIIALDEPGTVKDRVDEAWQSVKLGLVRAVSIGFRALEYAFMDSGGIRFIASEVLELSLVTIPANAEATISTVKSLDTSVRAATGVEDEEIQNPGATGQPIIKRPVSILPKGVKTMAKPISEQIQMFTATRDTKSARMSEIMEKSADVGMTLDASQSEEYDSLASEVASIDEHIKRLQSLDNANRSTVRAVSGATVEDGSKSRGADRVPATVEVPLEKGVRFARYARCMALGYKSHRSPAEIAVELYGDRDPKTVQAVKAAVVAVSTANVAALIGNEGGWADFVDFLRPQTIIGKFGTGGIPSLRRIPFRVPLISQSGGGTGYWVGEGKAKPLTKPTFGTTELAPLKVANICVATMEALRDSSPSAELLIRDDLANALAVRMDTSFIDPSNAASAGVRPASITNGLTAIASGGQDADAVRDDARRAMAAFVTAENPLTTGVWIMSASVALGLSVMINTLGQPEFPLIGINGGTFMGLPVIVSGHVGNYVVLANAADIWYADEGGVSVDISSEASLEMMDNPTGDSIAATPVAASLVSMFQTNSVAIRAERSINWAKRRSTAVAYISGVTWGTGAS